MFLPLYHRARKILLENADGVLFLLGGKWRCAGKGVGYLQLGVFVGAHGVVGENLYSLDDVGVAGDVLGEGCKLLVAVGEPWHDDMANPCGFLNLLQMVEQLLVGCSCVCRDFFVEAVVEGLDVKQYEVGVLECLLDFVVDNGSAGVDGCVESFLLAELEELDEEGGLHERFAASAGDSSLADEVFIAFNFVQEFFGCHLVGHVSLWVPCVGIVTEGASHRTALEKGYEPNSWAIYCSEGLYAVKSSLW